ncbi:YoaK family protein [Microvirga arabica]|uniref:YoaK family protein n=1 Tax=Microvirga arabica TaxID=1128671 RepID=UPI0019397A4A|nr:YoaK family protein [Microvirga arabica]MBM1173664.1 DUF1275 domain-containing protein [Microvirga arabica]
MLSRSIRTVTSSRRTAPDVRLPPVGTAARIAMGGLLTAVAGFVDAIGYIGVGGLFASFMSGASVSLGVGLGAVDWDPVHQGVLMIASFLSGVTLATVLDGLAGAWRLPAVLLLEALLLAAAVVLARSGWTIAAAILPVVAAMGVQNTALQPIDGVRLGVTFITGTLVSLGQALGQTLMGRAQVRRLGGHALLWGALTAGATAGAILHDAFGPMALTVPAILVSSLAMLSALTVLAHGHRRQADR